MVASRRVASWVRWVRRALFLVVAAGAVVTVLPSMDSSAWWIRMLDFPRMQFLLALLATLVLLVALPGRLRGGSIAAAIVAGVCVAWQAAVLLPYSPLPPARSIASEAACPDGRRLRVVAANVRMTNENAERLFDILRRADPDLILLQETDAWWDERLRALHGTWPHAAQHVTQNYFGMHLLSRYPLVAPEVRFLTSSRNPSIFTGVALPAGKVVRFFGVHPRPPLPGQSSAERDGQVLGAALAAREDGAPVVMAGDFNAVPWEHVMERVRRVGGFLSPRAGRGWVPSFRPDSLLVTWPLDHVLAGPGFTLRDFAALPDFGSDHRPVLAELCHAPEAAALQAARPLRAGDIAAARRAVETAQDRAAPSPEPPDGAQRPG